jgi:hypothetical protein
MVVRWGGAAATGGTSAEARRSTVDARVSIVDSSEASLVPRALDGSSGDESGEDTSLLLGSKEGTEIMGTSDRWKLRLPNEKCIRSEGAWATEKQVKRAK